MLLSLIFFNHTVKKKTQRLSSSVLEAYSLEARDCVFEFISVLVMPGILEVFEMCLILKLLI